MASASTSAGDYKCSKCRVALGVPTQQDGPESQAQIFLNQDSLPQWIEQKVSECSWTKTKLHCPNPNCNSRIGGVDFVGGASNPIHFIRSKVDPAMSAKVMAELNKQIGRVLEPSSSIAADTSSDDSGSSVSSSTDESDVTGSEGMLTDSSSSELGVANSSTSTSEENFRRNSSSSSTEELSTSSGFLSKHQKNRLRLKRRRKEQLELEKKRKAQLGDQKIRENKILQTIMDAEPELDDIDHSLICPVCLDLLYEPHKVDPCKHVFCEPCLRRLGSKNPMNTSCPMCRQRIVFCEPQRDLSRTIHESYHSMHIKRKKFERSTNVFTLPLPWRPGWKNLISGRAMGGNRLANETNGEALRQVLQQLPYYIPPVVIANLINLLFFICLLGAVEIIPLLFSLVMGKGPSGMSVLSKSGISPLVDAPVVPVTTDPSDVETSAPIEDISSNLLRDALQEEDEDNSNVDANILQRFAIPEATSPAMDATFYYIICSMSLMAAAFGNVLIIQQQPLIALLPQGTFLDRLFNNQIFGYHFQRFSDLFLIVGLSCVPVLLLPLVLPSPSTEIINPGENIGPVDNPEPGDLGTQIWLRNSIKSSIQIILVLLDSINSILTFQNLACLGVVYYVTCTFFNYRGLGAN